MGLFDNFLGGGTESTKPVQLPTMSPEQMQLFNQMLQQALGGIAAPAPKYPGQLYADTTPEQQSYYDWARSEAVKKVSQGQPLYEVGPEWAQQYFEQAIRPMYQYEWENTILPGIREGYAGPTYHGSNVAEATRKSATEMGLQLAAQKAGLTYGEEQARRQAIESAMGLMPQMSTAMAGPAQMTRESEQEKVMADLSRWLSGEEVGGAYNPWYNPAMSWAFNLLGISPYTYGEEGKAQGPGLGYEAIRSFLSSLGTAYGKKAAG